MKETVEAAVIQNTDDDIYYKELVQEFKSINGDYDKKKKLTHFDESSKSAPAKCSKIKSDICIE